MLNLGEISILHPEETFALTPASLVAIRAIAENQNMLSGVGIDWGSGSGCLAIVAARIPSVVEVFGLEISPSNVEIAQANAQENSVGDKVRFMLADSYLPHAHPHRTALHTLRGQVDFVLSNPPSSEDDGFEYRRIVLRGAREFLRTGGVVFLSISYQYGLERIERLTTDVVGFRYGGVLATTDWVPFDLSRPDLIHCLELYADEEQSGGPEYSFAALENPQNPLNAQGALERFRQTRRNPFSKWQTHLFVRESEANTPKC